MIGGACSGSGIGICVISVAVGVLGCATLGARALRLRSGEAWTQWACSIIAIAFFGVVAGWLTLSMCRGI